MNIYVHQRPTETGETVFFLFTYSQERRKCAKISEKAFWPLRSSICFGKAEQEKKPVAQWASTVAPLKYYLSNRDAMFLPYQLN